MHMGILAVFMEQKRPVMSRIVSKMSGLVRKSILFMGERSVWAYVESD